MALSKGEWGSGVLSALPAGTQYCTSQTQRAGYSQHSEGPQPVEGVDGNASQPVVAQDPAEKGARACWLFLFSATHGCTAHIVNPSEQTVSLPSF